MFGIKTKKHLFCGYQSRRLLLSPLHHFCLLLASCGSQRDAHRHNLVFIFSSDKSISAVTGSKAHRGWWQPLATGALPQIDWNRINQKHGRVSQPGFNAPPQVAGRRLKSVTNIAPRWKSKSDPNHCSYFCYWWDNAALRESGGRVIDPKAKFKWRCPH